MQPENNEKVKIKLSYLTTSKHYNTRYKLVYPYYKPIVRLIDYGNLSFNKDTKAV